MSTLDVIADRAKENLLQVPDDTLQQGNLKMIFLEGNRITKLPIDFFVYFPKLLWLDLRNNLLETIPKSVANHECLETLLLSNNRLVVLPNELGTVSTLKTLQVSENPLEYPDSEVLQGGTRVILSYLKEQYEKDLPEVSPSEELVKVYQSDTVTTPLDDIREDQLMDKLLQITDSLELRPTLSVKKLENPAKVQLQKKKEPVKIIHQLKRNPSKLSLKSFYSQDGTEEKSLNQKALRDAWLQKLKVLLADQEKILQQERNLRSLSSWRALKSQETLTTIQSTEEVEPPFAVYEEHKRMMTREELSQELSQFLKERSVSPKQSGTSYQQKLDSLVEELARQLREVEANNNYNNSPRTEIDHAGEQIKIIMDIHKKLQQIQGSNNMLL